MATDREARRRIKELAARVEEIAAQQDFQRGAIDGFAAKVGTLDSEVARRIIDWLDEQIATGAVGNKPRDVQDFDSLTRVLGRITHLEAALREIAERECEDSEDWEEEGTQRCPDPDFDRWCASYLARAALPTSKED